MSGPVAPPDIEELVTDVLRSALVPLVFVGVSTELPTSWASPWLRVTAIPGGAQADGNHPDHRLYRIRVQLEAWADVDDLELGEAKATVSDAIRATVTELIGLAFPYVHSAGVVTGIELESPPYWDPDPEDDSPRYIADVAVYAHAA